MRLPEHPPPACRSFYDVAYPEGLTCEQLAAAALRSLADRVPDRLRDGITAITALRTDCPRREMPPHVDCAGVDDVQLVTVTFARGHPHGRMESELTVAIHPFTGRVLGIRHPLIR